MTRTPKWLINSAWVLVLLPALSMANVTLPGDRHIGDDDDNTYAPADYITPAQMQNNPAHFSLSSDLTVTAVRVNNVIIENDQWWRPAYLIVIIDGAFVGFNETNNGEDTVITLNTPLNLTAGIHTMWVFPECYDFSTGGLCYLDDGNANDGSFSSVDLISTETSTHLSFNRRYHAGDSTFGNNEYNDAFYPDPPDGDTISIPFTLAQDSLLETVRFFNLRGEALSGCRASEIFIDKTKIGEISAYGDLVITLGTPLSLTAAVSYDLIITSGRCQGNNKIDFSWDDIILEFSDATVGGFLITAPANGSTCVPITVDIQALKNNGTPETNYNKQVQISTSSGHGDWVLTAGVGTFIENPGDDNGVAFYEFVAGGSGDGGTISLTLFNTHADDLTISVVEVGNVSTLSTTSTITFRDNAFVVTPTDPLGSEVVAGRPHAMKIEMWTRDGPGGSNCTVNSLYDGTIALDAWITRSGNDPGGIAPSIKSVPLPNAQTNNNLSLTFINGVAMFNGAPMIFLNTADVGQYSIQFVDDDSGFAKDAAGNPRPIIGSTASVLTVRPFGFAFSNVAMNSGSSGPIVAAAGDPFSTTITAVAWQNADDGDGDGLPDTGANLNDNATTPAYSATTQLSAVAPFTPASGVLGLLNGGSVNIAFSGGSASPTNLQYSEVGEVTLLAQIDDYLGTGGADVQSRSVLVGRFVPDRFDMTVSQGCTVDNFTYSGQPLSSVTVTALNAMGAITQNYFGSFAKTLTFATPATTGALINTTGAASLFASGVATYTGLPTFTFTNKETAPAPINLTVSDTDGVSSVAPAPTMTIRSGRIALQDVAGSELLPLNMPVVVQYFDNGWQTNTLDTMCTVLDATTDFSFITNAVSTTIGNPINDTGDGTWTLPLSAPGTTGFAEITADGIDAWLQDDWDEDGTVDDNPQARASFGLYNGNKKQIYIRE